MIEIDEEKMETELNKVNPEQEADKPKQCACRHKHGKIVAVILVVLIVGAICWHVHPRPTGLKPGMYCAVELRRDMTSSTVPVTIIGELIATNREAILLKHTGLNCEQLWIPKSSIMYIECNKRRTE